MMGSTDEGSPLSFVSLVTLLQLIFIFMYGFLVHLPSENGAAGDGDSDFDRINSIWPLYENVHVMIFVGFGFLMTFLAQYSWSSVSYCMLVSVLCLQWGILCDWIWEDVFTGRWNELVLKTENLVSGDFAAAATLISFAGILGRITPTQLVAMAFLEVCFYSLNKQIIFLKLLAIDDGGSIYIHTFGAYFGLAVSAVLGEPLGNPTKAEILNSSIYQSDLFAMIGTLFLFIFWPSFNAVQCHKNGFLKERAVINTVLALSCSAMMAFASSKLFEPNHKFNMVHVQNATLAGGVTIGAAADLVTEPYVPMLLGVVAGIVCTAGYSFLSPYLESKGLRDTCGVNNLHGIPGVLGGIASIFVVWFSEPSNERFSDEIYPADRSTGEQALYQAFALFVTLAISMTSGFLVGTLLKSCCFKQCKNAYCDSTYWVLQDEDDIEEHKLGYSNLS